MDNSTIDKSTLYDGRRTFLKKSALLGAGLIISPLFSHVAFGNTAPSAGSRMASTSFLDDCFRIVSVSNEIGAPIKAALESNIYKHVPGNTARLGRTFPSAIQHATSLMVVVKKNLRENKESNFADEKMAFSLGVLAQIGLDKNLGSALNKSETGIYLDAAILKDMNGMNPGDLIKGSYEELADLFRGMSPRFLTRIHTSIPDDEDAENWILRVDQWRRDLDRYYDELAQVYLNPDKNKYNSLIVRPGLYNPTDGLIKLARSTQRSTVKHTNISGLINKNIKQSSYANAMAVGYKLILAADQFINDQIDEEAFKVVLSKI